MIIGPKYKIARRLGAPIFEKTQTQKYAQRLERRGKKKGFSKPKSEFGIQLNEKQKARFIYGLSEKQFSNYVKEALAKKASKATDSIYTFLESRLDNVIYRMGFAPTRMGARQMVSHGHIMVNGKRLTAPSRRMIIGDKVSIREGSTTKTLFKDLDEKLKNTTNPSWIHLDAVKKNAEITGVPQLAGAETMFDLNAVVEFYSR